MKKLLVLLHCKCGDFVFSIIRHLLYFRDGMRKIGLEQQGCNELNDGMPSRIKYSRTDEYLMIYCMRSKLDMRSGQQQAALKRMHPIGYWVASLNSGAQLLGLGLGSSTLCLFLVGGYLVSATAL